MNKRIAALIVLCSMLAVLLVTGCTSEAAKEEVSLPREDEPVEQEEKVATLEGVTQPPEEEPVTQPEREQPSSPQRGTAIIDVTWTPDMQAINIELDNWPGSWGKWKVYVDGLEIPTEGGAGQTVIRPNSPLDKPPTGLYVGTLPWVTGLTNVDFPCCGTIQLYIPGHGLTNTYQYNLRDFGCATASTKECPSEFTVHEGDLVVEGKETRLIEDEKFIQRGNVYIRDGATLIIRDTEFIMVRGDVPTVHVYFFVDPLATLVIENSKIISTPQGGTEAGLICVINRGEVRMNDSPTQIHYFDMSEGAKLEMTNSEMVNPIGGLLQVSGGEMRVVDSILGALALFVPAGASMEINGLYSGTYLEYWDVHEMIPQANYDLVLERTTIMKDDFTGMYEHGPYERGWLFFIDSSAHVRISDSELRKVFLDVREDTVAFQDLKAGIPCSLTYRDIVLEDVVIMGQWPFTITDANVTFTNSDHLFLQTHGSSTVTLIDSHIVEFIPRNFFGEMIFQNGLWTTAGEIIGGVPYHSMFNDFSIKGSLRTDNLRSSLQWKEAQVNREFKVVVTNAQGIPVSGAVLKVDGNNYETDNNGKTTFSITFDETNYNQLTNLEIWQGDTIIGRHSIDFFTETPVEIVVTS